MARSSSRCWGRGPAGRFASELIGEREVARGDHRAADQRRPQQLEQHLARDPSAGREGHAPSEVIRLEDCTGYLKLATRLDWMAVGFKPIDFPTRVDAAVPIALPLRDAAD